MKRFLTSFFLQVALASAMVFVAGLWFIADQIIPQAVITTAEGTARHIFWQPEFMGRAVIAYFMALPVIYGLACWVRWMTAPASGSERRE